jgi:hypothetical protein
MFGQREPITCRVWTIDAATWSVCFDFPFILITGHSSTKRCPKGSPAFQTGFSSALWGTAVPFPLGNQDQSLQPADSDSCRAHSDFHFSGITVMSPGGSTPPFGTKTCGAAAHKVRRLRGWGCHFSVFKGQEPQSQ